MKVTVIVLSYNHEKYIARALDSILNQVVDFDYEIIVGDDASTDGTVELVQKYARMYPDKIIPVFREENVGGTANLVDVFLKARGEYIASCEGDDYWLDENKLKKQIDFLDSNKQFIGCTHRIKITYRDGGECKLQKLEWISEKETFRLRDFKGVKLPGHPVSMVYRNVFTNNDTFLNIICNVHKHVADRTVVMLLLTQGDICRVPGVMACYCINDTEKENNLTNKLFDSNTNGKVIAFKITCNLENACQKVLGIKKSFLGYKLELLIRAFVKAIIYRSGYEWNCFLSILRQWKKYRKDEKVKLYV